MITRVTRNSRACQMKYQICTYYSCFWTLLDAWKQEALYRYVSRVYAETVALM